jgi:formate-dependent nitrite reductase membrane component NrfD
MSDTLGMRALDPDASARGVSDGAQLPAHAAPTYYDRPLLKKPHWEGSVITYLFLGGLMGGTGVLVALADEDGDDEALARNGRHLALALALVCPPVLISHLGRPERFLNMLRIFKIKSVMSMGVWGLVAFTAPSAAAAAAQLSRDEKLPEAFDFLQGLAPRPFTNALQAALGSFIAGYTGVLLSATANPLWSSGKRHIPALCVASAFAGACAANTALLALGGGNASTSRKLERLETIAGLAELGLLVAFRKHAGDAGKPMFEGTQGRKLRDLTMLGGIVAPALLSLVPGHSRLKTLLSSALVLAGGYALRETLVEAGKTSADDPRVASIQPL